MPSVLGHPQPHHGVSLALPIIAFRAHYIDLTRVRTAVVLREQIVFAIKPQKAEEVADAFTCSSGCTNHISRLHVPHHQFFTRHFTTHPPSVVVVFRVINRAFNIRAALNRPASDWNVNEEPMGRWNASKYTHKRRGVLHTNAQGPHGSVLRHGRIGLFEKVKRGIDRISPCIVLPVCSSCQ